jgi:hypothetical protein
MIRVKVLQTQLTAGFEEDGNQLREERLGRDYKINVYERCQFTIP